MKLLEDWITDIIKKPIKVLNDECIDEDKTKEPLDLLYLPLIDRYSVEQKATREASHVSDVILHNLHQKIRKCVCEEPIWFSVIWYLSHPLPISIAHDLIDRGIAVFQMALSRQVDEVQWRLATFNEDALYTLIRERYMESRYSVDQFDMMLKLYEYNIDGIIYMLSFYATPSPEKEAVFLAAIEREKGRVSDYIRQRFEDFFNERLRKSVNAQLE